MRHLRQDTDYRLTRVLFAAVAYGVAVLGNPRNDWAWLLGFVIAYSALEVMPLRLPQGGSMPVAVGVVVVSLSLLGPLSTLAVQISGQCLAAAFSDPVSDGRGLLRSVLRRALAAASALLLLRYAGAALPSVTARSSMLLLILAGLVYTLVDAYGFAVLESAIAGASVMQNMGRLLGLVGWVYLSQLSVGVVFVVVREGLGLLAAPILLLLMLLLQSSFALLLRVRTAYVSTVGALARLAERQSPENAGHAERVARLCAAIGRRLRLSHEALEALSFAATLHDVGYLKLECTAQSLGIARGLDPIASEAGASIIESVDFLAPATRVLRAHSTSFDGSAVELRPTDQLLAAVLEAGCAFDHAVRSSSANSSVLALDSVSRNPLVARYPSVVEALTDLIGRGEVGA